MADTCILAEEGTTFIDGKTGKVAAVADQSGGVSVEDIRQNLCGAYLNRLLRECQIGDEILFYVYDQGAEEFSPSAVLHLEYDEKERIGKLTYDESGTACYSVVIPYPCRFKAWAELGSQKSSVLQVDTEETEDGIVGPYTLQLSTGDE